jgi:DNA-binding MarR family transcriptional regulator
MVTPDNRAGSDARQTVLSNIRVLVSRLSRSARAVEQKTGITNAQLYLLRQLDGVEGLSVNELASRARTSQSTASILAKRLHAAGLVQRARSTTDGRSTILSMTAAGRRLLKKAPPPPTQSLFDGLDALTEHEAKALAKALRPLLKNMHFDQETATLLFEER